ncbi:MAG TPA: hypothetical protein VNM67_17595 [Thermoanaerobaculia bacterium]|jgi:hypothetical protein|nr:hypothetical protein [Thermoanaerobaculia bacterium]
MNGIFRLKRVALAAVLAVAVAAPAGATTLKRMGLEDLVKTHGKIVVGEVVDVRSYWNHDGNFILTDVRFFVEQVVKGRLQEKSEITVTLLGGEVGDLSTLIIGGADLVKGNSYVLFLNEQNLPGADNALTVREHVQGAFDVKLDKGGLRAISQAVRHPLLPDADKLVDPPGGREGLPLNTMIQSMRAISARESRREVK